MIRGAKLRLARAMEQAWLARSAAVQWVGGAVVLGITALLISSLAIYGTPILQYMQDSLGTPAFGFAMAGLVIGSAAVITDFTVSSMTWILKGYPLPKRGFLARREARKVAARQAVFDEKQAAVAANEAELRRLRQDYIKMGEKLASRAGANPLTATVRAHDALLMLEEN